MHRFLVIGVLALACLVLSAPAAAWTWPAEGAVLRPFGLGPDPYAGGQHRGIDVGGAEGSPVRAPATGTVTFAGSLPTHGRGITIQTEDGYAVTLVHLGTIGVTKGVVLLEGAPVGTVGWSGTPEHAVPSVHLGIRRASEEEGYVDPLGLLPPRAAPAPSAEPPPVAAPAAAPAPLPAAAPPPASPSGAPSAPAPAAPAPAAPPPSPVAAPHPNPPPAPTAAPPPAAAAATAVPPPVAPPAADVQGARTGGGGDASASAGMWIDSPHGTSTSTGRAAGQEGPASQLPRAAPVTHGSAPVAAVATGDRRPLALRAPAGSTPAASRTVDRAEVARLSGGGERVGPFVVQPPDRATPQAGGRSVVVRDEPEAVGRAASAAAGVAAADAGHRADTPSGARTAPETPLPARAVGALAQPIGDGAVPLGPVLAAFVLGCVLAVAGARKGARRIACDGGVLRHDADLLRELDSPHRARVHDRGRGRLRAPSATARS